MTVLPARPGFGEQVRSLYIRAGEFPVTILSLMMRVALGTIFLKSALAKTASWDTTVALFREEYAVPLLPPELAAELATATELVCAVLLFAGLATRLAALPLLGLVLVIQLFVYPQNWVDHLSWAAMLLFLVTRGPGALSIDHLVRRQLEQRWGY